MGYFLGNALQRFNWHSGWIIWNLFLAFIPLTLSFWLFRRRTRSRSPLWWGVLLVFIAFLPNAPYLLTDIIHLIRAIRAGYSIWIVALVFMPLHLFAILSGFEAYVICVMNQNHYLHRNGAGRFVLLAELITHALAAIGVFMGRFRRFNSWDLVTDPSSVIAITLDDLTTKRPLVVMVITFVGFTILYWIAKQITLGIVLRIRSTRLGEILDLEPIPKLPID
jgi:uncharacterized membrane protein